MHAQTLPGLVGRIADYLCDFPDVDTGLANGAALEIVATVATGLYSAPFVGLLPARSEVSRVAGLDVSRAKDRFVPFESIYWGTTLIGPETDCTRVLGLAESLASVVVHPGPAPKRRCRLSYWSNPDMKPFWMPPTGSGLPSPVMIGASGDHRQSELAPEFPRADLVRELRAIHVIEGRVNIGMEPTAREAFRGSALAALRDTQTYGDPGPALRRWMFVLSVVAIGIEPDAPLITGDLLEPAAWLGAGGHSLLLMSFRSSAAGTQTPCVPWS
jgi:hypothetical protein